MRIGRALSILAFLAVPASVAASGAGSSGAEFLRTAMGARPAALGENFTGLADDVNAAVWNPAGLGRIRDIQFSTMYMSYIEDVSYGYLAASMPFGEWGSAALSTIYANVPPFDSTGVDSMGKGSAADAMVALSWGGSFKPLVPTSPELHGICYGLTGKFIYRSLGGYRDAMGNTQTLTATAAALDAGFFWLADPRFTVGLMVQNIGSTITFLGDESDALPFAIRAGAAWKGLETEWFNATVLADVARPIDPDGGSLNVTWGGAGLEFGVAGVLALRGGYRNGPEGATLVGGGGLGWGPVSLDFAFVPMAELGRTMRYGITVRTGGISRKLPRVGGLAASAGAKKRVTLKWSAVPGAAGYHVEVRKPGASSFSRITKEPRQTTEVPFKGLKPGMEYGFRVMAVDENFDEGRPSEITFTVPVPAPEKPVAIPLLPAPAAPLANFADDSVNLVWTPMTGAAGYNVYYRRDRGGMRKITPVPRTGSTLAIKVKSAIGLEFAVAAINAAGKEGAKSRLAPVNVEVTQAPEVSRLPAPGNLGAFSSAGRVKLNWAAVAGAAGDNIYFRRGTAEFKKVNPAPKTGTELGIKVKNSVGAEFAVAAVDDLGREGEMSAPVPVSPGQ